MSRGKWREEPLPERVAALESPIKRAALRLHRELGPGFREAVYRKALAHALRKDGLALKEEVWLDVEFEGLLMRNAVRADIIVEELVLVELKAVETFHPIHRGQVVSYLKAADLALGLLFNFNSDAILRSGCERMVHPRYLTPLPELATSGRG